MLPESLVLGVAMAALTVAAYSLARGLFLRYQHPLLQPVFLGAGMVIAVLGSLGLGFEEYRPVRDVLTWPLGPATVALAVPAYNQRGRLRAAAFPMVCGVVVGVLTTIAAVIGLAALSQLEVPVLRALAVKSVTAPIAVELARLYGDDPSLTAVFVVATGMLGAMLGPTVLTRCRVADPVARGVALGSISHGQGTAAALLESETAGAMSSLAMVGAAVVTALVAPLYVPWLVGLLAG
jgi:putative effector of murein hydrolase